MPFNIVEGRNLAFIVTKSHFITLQWWWVTWHSNFPGCFGDCYEISFFLCEAIHQRSIWKKINKKQKNMKLVAGNVFYICKGRLYLALLLPFQKKSNMILKKIIKLSSFLIAIKFIPEKTLHLSWSKTNHLLTKV